MALNNIFAKFLNAMASMNSELVFANGPFPNRKACAVCPQITVPTMGPSGNIIEVSRPVNFFVQHPASGCPSPQRRWNASKQIPAVGSGQADWVTCVMASSGSQIPVPNLWHIRTNGPAPNQTNAPSEYWVEVQYIGYGF